MTVLHLFVLLCVIIQSSGSLVMGLDSACKGLSKDAGCTACTPTGRCLPGNVPIDPWLYFATKTQRELQIDEQWHRLQMLDAHNGYNSRAFGYGELDTCNWPPPYDNRTCITFANQEFSLIDLLSMGIRAMELDIVWCSDGQMRMVHSSGLTDICKPKAKLYSEGLREIADWLNQTDNQQEMIRLYINEKTELDLDDEVNGPLELYLGDRLLTPAERRDEYGDAWPTMRQMREAGKNVVVTAGNGGRSYTHGGVYIHDLYWDDLAVRSFSDFPKCGNKSIDAIVRYYSDGTRYGPIYDGVESTGIILDFGELVKCGVQYPSTDFITPALVATSVFTWAVGQPSGDLHADSCVWINKTDWRWYVTEDCALELHCACQSTSDANDWTVSSHPGPYSTVGQHCPSGYSFSVPQNGYRNEMLRKSADDQSVWINYAPWLRGPVASIAPSADKNCLALSLVAPLICILISRAF